MGEKRRMVNYEEILRGTDRDSLLSLCKRITGYSGSIVDVIIFGDNNGLQLRFKSDTMPFYLMRLNFTRSLGVYVVSCIKRNGDKGAVLSYCNELVAEAGRRCKEINNELGI